MNDPATTPVQPLTEPCSFRFENSTASVTHECAVHGRSMRLCAREFRLAIDARDERIRQMDDLIDKQANELCAAGLQLSKGRRECERYKMLAHRFDVGADVMPQPVTLATLATLADAQTFAATDHHGDL